MSGFLRSTIPLRFSRLKIKREFSLLSAKEEFPDLPNMKSAMGKTISTAVSKLSNGLTIVSESGSSSSTVSLTFPHAGSSSELASESGAALANKFMAFKSGSGLSSAVILRNLQNYGATPFVSVDRGTAAVGFTAAPDNAIYLLPLLATTCAYEKWDVKSALDTAAGEVQESLNNIQTVLTESLYSAAYGPQSALGRTMYADGASAEAVRSFRERNYVLNGAILSATGIPDHKTFVEQVQAAFSESTYGSSAPSSGGHVSFIGGEARVHAPSSGYSHVAIAFPSLKGSSSALLNVMKYCLSLSVGGGISGFTSKGMIGVYGFSNSANASVMVDALCSAFKSAPESIVVERAKALAKAEARFALDGDSRSVAKAMAEYVTETGSFSPCALTDAYDAVTSAQIKEAFKSLTNSVSPAVAAVGDLTAVPYRGSIITKLA